ncbi:NAD kinase, partial [Mesorhizobium ciceri]
CQAGATSPGTTAAAPARQSLADRRGAAPPPPPPRRAAPPRGGRPALLSNNATVRFDIREPEKRPVNAAADHTEVKAVTSVTVRESPTATATLLFDPNHSWNERILAEQFRY